MKSVQIKAEYNQLLEMAIAFGVRALGTALVVNSYSTDFRDKGPEWVSSPTIAAESKLTTKADPGAPATRLRRFMHGLPDVRTLFRNQAFRQSQRGSKKGKEGKKGKKAQSFCLFCPLCLFCFPCFIDSITHLRKVSRHQEKALYPIFSVPIFLPFDGE